MKNRNIKAIMILSILAISLIVAGGLYFLITTVPSQSILSLSSVTVADGKVYWVLTASANKPGDIYNFTYKPSNYTYSNGTIVSPRGSLSLKIEPGQAQCVYQLQKSTYSSLYPYYILKNPAKEIAVKVTDGNSRTVTLDGSSVASASITDSDGNGQVTIETQGLLSGKYNCPDYDNVAILIDASSNTYAVAYKDEVNTWISSHTGLFCTIGSVFGFCGGNTKPQANTAFTSSFGNLSVSTTELAGDISSFGYPVFTITADQDYFDSVIYTPAITAKPKITSLSCPTEIKQGEGYSMVVKLENQLSSTGLVYLSATSSNDNGISVSPSSTNIQLSSSSKSKSFTLEAGSSIGTYSITAKACGVDQFNANNNCVTKACSIKVVSSSSSVPTFCGDGTCNSNEDYLTCPSDCATIVCDEGYHLSGSVCVQDEPEACKWYQTSYKTNSCGFWCSLGLAEVTTTSGCKLSGWIVAVAIVSFLIVAFLLFFAVKLLLKKISER